MLGVVALAVSGSYPEFPDNCFLGQFSLGKHVLKVLVDGANVLLEQLCHELLGKPDGVVLEPALDARLPILGLIEDNAGLRGGAVRHGGDAYS
jgi:hypothetical protein